MIRFRAIFILSAILFIFGGCATEDPLQIDNSPPVILSVRAEPQAVPPNTELRLVCLAEDPEDDELTYTWTPYHGTYPQGNKGAEVTWRSPADTCSLLLEVTVGDGYNEVKGEAGVNIISVKTFTLESPVSEYPFVIEMVWIPRGTFMMGTNVDSLTYEYPPQYYVEIPHHPVYISEGFWMGKYELTQSQWRRVMGSSWSYFPDLDRPREGVTYNQIEDFLEQLNRMQGEEIWRLPSEAEWEYAARAGTTTRFPWGDDWNYEHLGEYAWYNQNSCYTTQPVGLKAPNPWGLHDIFGNVWEYCADDWHPNYEGAPSDGRPWIDGNGSDLKVFRGGGWYHNQQHFPVSFRHQVESSYMHYHVGFRLVREQN